ncbi:MAG: ABC transporter permease [Actinobacteria bacterium]|nr:MAG: ABC transporter permease [Actinomycetota bacterium]
MNIYRHELKSFAKSTIIWTCSLTVMIVLYLLLFPAFTKDIAVTRKLFSALPKAARAALDLDLDTFFSLLGFYSYLLNFVVLAGAIQAMNIGAGIISKEYRFKTADFLLSKPVTRTKVMTQKLLAALTLILATDVVFISSALAWAKIMIEEPFSAKIFLMLSAILVFVQLIFLVLGALFATVFSRIKSVVSVTLPTVFALFIVDMIGSILDAKNYRYFTPFKYFDSQYIMKHAAYEWRFIILEVVVIACCIAASYIIYLKKDIASVT